ncbi:MAG: fibronectin type III domain-containing protein [Eubacterium sp.]
MKKIFSLLMAIVVIVSSLSLSFSVSAADLEQIKSETVGNAKELPCDSQWKEYSGNNSAFRDFYQITVASSGKLNLKIEASASLEATLTNAEFTREYFTVYAVPAQKAETVIKNQTVTAGTYYLSVKCDGKYRLNATFGGNCYDNPQLLEPNIEVAGASTEIEGGWWYKLNIPSDAIYIFSASSYGNTDVRIYGNDLTNAIDNIALSGSSDAPAAQKKNVSLDKGAYYICVNSDSKYTLSWCMLTQDNCTHSFTHQYIKATYTTKGYQLNVCSVCGYTYKDNYSAKKTLSAPALYSLKKGSKKISVSFGRSFNATGYQIQYSTNKKFTGKSVKKITTKNLSKTINNLKGRTKYYVRVRAYKKVDGKTVFSPWSDIKSVTTKK